VSVVMATYNHAPYVERAIRSVLDQTFGEFEFLVGDDGSTDSTREVVSRCRDSRVAWFPNAVNRGACAVMNELIERAAGEYVAVLNSDDYWPAGKLAYQVDFMDRHREYGALFGRASFIDEQGRPIPKRELSFGAEFDQENRSRGKWLRRFFDAGNCLCHPSVLIRRACYGEVGLYDNRYRQLPDWDMWIRLAKKYEVFVSDRELVSLRILPGRNASSQTGGNVVRKVNEHYLIAMRFFDGMSKEILMDGFSEVLRVKDPPSEIHCDIEKALLYFVPNQFVGHVYKVLGLRRLHELLGSKRHRSVLEGDYGIDARAFQRLSEEVDVFRPIAGLRSVPRSELIREVVRRVRARLAFSR
jgi:glycosyltransferase involved in cell wall biosynthesis